MLCTRTWKVESRASTEVLSGAWASLDVQGVVQAGCPEQSWGSACKALSRGTNRFSQNPLGHSVENGLQRVRLATGSPRGGLYLVPARGDAGWSREGMVTELWAGVGCLGSLARTEWLSQQPSHGSHGSCGVACSRAQPGLITQDAQWCNCCC